MTFEQTFFLIGFITILFLGLGVPCILMFSQACRERKSNKEHQQYIDSIKPDSIKPGDVFDWDNRAERPYRNPFNEIDDSQLRTAIIDIKTNEAGVKWVKYYYTHAGSGSKNMWFTDKLEDYLKNRYRIQTAE